MNYAASCPLGLAATVHSTRTTETLLGVATMADQRAFLITAMKYPAEGEKRDVEQTQQIVDCMRAVHLCAFTKP